MRQERAPRMFSEPIQETARTAPPCKPSEWLESPLLARIVKRVGHQYGIPPGEIDDLVQEVRIALWGARWQPEIKPAWVFATASHKAVDLLRRRPAGEIAICPPAPREITELTCLARVQMGQLPERLRVFCDLRYVEGLTEREIAARMGLCRASVRWLGLRCLKALGAGSVA